MLTKYENEKWRGRRGGGEGWKRHQPCIVQLQSHTTHRADLTKARTRALWKINWLLLALSSPAEEKVGNTEKMSGLVPEKVIRHGGAFSLSGRRLTKKGRKKFPKSNMPKLEIEAKVALRSPGVVSWMTVSSAGNDYRVDTFNSLFRYCARAHACLYKCAYKCANVLHCRCVVHHCPDTSAWL